MTRPLRSYSLSRVVHATTSRSAPVSRIGTLCLARSTCSTFSLRIATTGSHVPHKSPMHGHAALIPDAAWPRSRFITKLIPASCHATGFDIIQSLSIRHQRFAYARLHASHLTEFSPPFPSTLTTEALNPSSLWWFETCYLQPIPRDLPSSLVQPETTSFGGFSFRDTLTSKKIAPTSEHP